MIGEAWNIDDPTKPWALWDPDANLIIPIGVTDWLAEMGVAYGSHQVIAAAPLECADQGTNVGGVIGVRMKLAAAAVYKKGTKYPFTIRLTGADAISKDDRTLWLQVKPR